MVRSHFSISSLRFLALLVSVLAWTAFSHAAETTQRQVLIFSIDQSLPNGPVQNGDIDALKRAVTSLTPFSQKYDVYVLLGAAEQDKGKLVDALDMVANANMEFVLDVYSSDIMMTPPGNSPADVSHGQALTMPQLIDYKKKYGSHFAGIRVFETLAQSYGIAAAKQGGAKYIGGDWIKRVVGIMPKDNFFEKSILELYFKFAYENKIFLVFSDWYWPNDPAYSQDPASLRQPENLQTLKDLLIRYPNTAYVLYNNNQPSGAAISNRWTRDVQPFVADGAKGFGLSDQAWLCTGSPTAELTCPVDMLIKWTQEAFNDGAILVQTEPYWYWWNFPRGGFTSNDYNQPTDATLRGTPKPSLSAFAAALGVSILPQ